MGRWLASIAGMFMLVAIISGIITHKKIFADFFTFRPKKGGQRAWMDGHNALSVLGLPFHLMITFSGPVLFMAMLMPAGIMAVYENPRQYSDDVFAAFKVTPPRNEAAPSSPWRRWWTGRSSVGMAAWAASRSTTPAMPAPPSP